MTGPETTVGSADNYVKPGTGTLFRYNTRTGTLEQTRHVNWNLGGTMTLQPDGKLWGSVLTATSPSSLRSTQRTSTPGRRAAPRMPAPSASVSTGANCT